MVKKNTQKKNEGSFYDSVIHKSSSFLSQPSSNARSQSCLAMSSIINSDLLSISKRGTCNLVKFNTSKTLLLTLFNTSSNYPVLFEDSEIFPLNSINILDLKYPPAFLGGTILFRLPSQPPRN